MPPCAQDNTFIQSRFKYYEHTLFWIANPDPGNARMKLRALRRGNPPPITCPDVAHGRIPDAGLSLYGKERGEGEGVWDPLSDGGGRGF